MDIKKTCVECNKIRCRKCGWEPDRNEVVLIKTGELTSCPICGWRPGKDI